MKNRRTYRLGKRGIAMADTRASVVEAAMRLLQEDGHHLTLQEIAQEAGVSRVTIYNQFTSRLGVLEAVFDRLGTVSEASGVRLAAEQHADPRRALGAMTDASCRFWGSHRIVFRRLYALAAEDPELHQVIASRESRRDAHIRTTVSRLGGGPAHAQAGAEADLGRVLTSLLGFAFFDQLAGADRPPYLHASRLLAAIVTAVIDGWPQVKSL
jgi:AcrR family transcriptional regulator